ncbi:hypothetical protein GQ43DRAFT_112884 [Delitschia confertaspora ATCC 74209]|uniref:ER-golgi trafficking TRAPP I complex 85 kDa subunit-domain-containing protein n=1 Tax=Delitschia confertaspora ATCC 74209 TaxID=1513339 RepID=A0A9P4MR28_9PLEO|nr:hypothetical protein GQ43DRAFT_112884 [Delitschia confertaspora ATCC 74209]
MTPLQDATTSKPPKYPDPEAPITLPKQRASLSDLPYRKSNPSLSTLFASTASLSGSRPGSGTATPTASAIPGSVFSPGSRQNGTQSPVGFVQGISDESRSLIQRAFVPHVAVLASESAEEILRAKGFEGGFLQLLRPFGEAVPGKVTIRDSVGVNRSWEDFGVRFVFPTDGLEVPSVTERNAEGSTGTANGQRDSGKPLSSTTRPSLRTGGDVQQIEEVVDRHLQYSEFQSPEMMDYLNHKNTNPQAENSSSPFYTLYLRRLLSGLPLSPHETFSHPTAYVVAISSRDKDAVDKLNQLYARTEIGDLRLPQWVGQQVMRYYVLIHEEEHADTARSHQLFETMKRFYGLNCHLLRLKSNRCIPSDDDSVPLPTCEWISAGEELAEIQKHETADDITDPTPYLFDSDVTAIRSFIRELVAQSLVPHMERMVHQWNEQVLARRRGLSGRFMSLSKRWTPFGGRNSSSPIPMSNSNYDSLQGFYGPDAPEATMRKLADYCFMLRDYKLAFSTYEILRTDFNNDKAWRHYAGASEMAAISTLMSTQPIYSKTQIENIDVWLEAASYSYTDRGRSATPFYALRTLALGVELLRLRGSSAADDAARWVSRILELNLVGPVGRALFTERAGACYAVRTGTGSMRLGSRRRKAALWSVMAAEQWVRLEKSLQAEKCLDNALQLYKITSETDDGESIKAPFEKMQSFIDELRQRILTSRLANRGFNEQEEQVEQQRLAVEEVSETLDKSPKAHRKSLLGAAAPPIDVGPLSPSLARTREREEEKKDDQFE